MFKHQPITENESKELLFDSYVTYVHSHHCANCGAIETFSQCFEVWLHPTKTRSTNLRDLRPVVGLELKPMNMAQLDVPPRKIPICHKCVGSYKVIGSPQTVSVKTSLGEWQETLRRKYEPPKAEPKVAKPATASKKFIPTLGDL